MLFFQELLVVDSDSQLWFIGYAHRLNVTAANVFSACPQ